MQNTTFTSEVQKENKKLSLMRDAPFLVYFYIIQTTTQKKGFSPRRDAHSKLKKGSRLGEMHIFSLYVYNTNDFEIAKFM